MNKRWLVEKFTELARSAAAFSGVEYADILSRRILVFCRRNPGLMNFDPRMLVCMMAYFCGLPLS